MHSTPTHFLSGDGEERLDLGVELPPGPVAQRQVLLDVALEDAERQALLEHLLVLLLHAEEAYLRLQHADDLAQGGVAQLLELTEHARLEEHLGGAEAIELLAERDVLQDGTGCLRRVHEALGYRVGAEDAVALLELGVDHSVGKALAANADALEHTVTGELVHDQVGV